MACRSRSTRARRRTSSVDLEKAIQEGTSTTPFPFNILYRQTRGVVRALREILGYSGFRIKGKIERGGTKNRPLTPRDLDRCRKLARRI